VKVRLSEKQVVLLMNYITALKRSYFKKSVFRRVMDTALDSTILPTLQKLEMQGLRFVVGVATACTVDTGISETLIPSTA
jgi:hypothetical protein